MEKQNLHVVKFSKEKKKEIITMIFNVFAKRITGNNGKSFTKYVTTLTKKDGTKVYTDVHFNDDIKNRLNTFPCTVTIPNDGANFNSRKVKGKDKDGNETEYTRNNLWVTKITTVTPYIDHSLDDFA